MFQTEQTMDPPSTVCDVTCDVPHCTVMLTLRYTFAMLRTTTMSAEEMVRVDLRHAGWDTVYGTFPNTEFFLCPGHAEEQDHPY